MDDEGEVGLYLRLFIAFIVIFLSISSSSILVLLSGASAAPCAFWRTFIAFLILLPIRLLRKGSEGLSVNRDTALLSALSGLLLAAHFLLWMTSLFLVPVALSTTAVVTYPLFAVLVDRLIFKEQVKPIQTAGLTIGFTGLLLFTQPQVLGGYSVLGISLSLLGALAASLYFSIGRAVRRRADTLSYAIIAYASASTALAAYASAVGENLLNHPFRAYVYFILLALIPMIGGHTLINYMLRYMKTFAVTSIALGEPIGASILAHLILGQGVDVLKALAMAVVLSSIALTIYGESSPRGLSTVNRFKPV